MANDKEQIKTEGESPLFKEESDALELNTWLERLKDVLPFNRKEFVVRGGLPLINADRTQIILNCCTKAGGCSKLSSIFSVLHNLGVIRLEQGEASFGFDGFFIIISVDALRKMSEERMMGFTVEMIKDVRKGVGSTVR